ncbi:MAG: hypothetical protein J7K72_00395 [Candidatus Aenigmarchaeota archaeon]|nr:hypothetical protein [Candidatus Aenigmarchaeota archaeon]
MRHYDEVHEKQFSWKLRIMVAIGLIILFSVLVYLMIFTMQMKLYVFTALLAVIFVIAIMFSIFAVDVAFFREIQ